MEQVDPHDKEAQRWKAKDRKKEVERTKIERNTKQIQSYES